MRRTTNARGDKAKATKLHSLLVRSRQVCENCGETEYAKLQCAHIVSRRYSATRTDENNAFCLCARCHLFFTDWPLEFADFVASKIGLDGYEALRVKAQVPTKMDWASEVERLAPLVSTRSSTSGAHASEPISSRTSTATESQHDPF